MESHLLMNDKKISLAMIFRTGDLEYSGDKVGQIQEMTEMLKQIEEVILNQHLNQYIKKNREMAGTLHYIL